MTPFERERMRRRAEAKLAALRERAARLRKRVVAWAAIGFVVLWAAIFAQMITGHDPALGPTAAAVRGAAQESVAADPEQRVLRASSPLRDDEAEEGWGEAERVEDAERIEEERLEAAAEAERAALEASEAEELEAVTTGQS